MKRFVPALAAGALVGALACGDATGPRDRVAVTLSVTRVGAPQIVIGASGDREVGCSADLEARAVGSGSATWEGGTIRVYLGRDRSAPATTLLLSASDVASLFGQGTINPGDTQRGSLYLQGPLPFEVSIVLERADRSAGQLSDSTRFACGPTVTSSSPTPQITGVTLASAKPSIEPGDTVTLRYTVTSVGLWSANVSLSGPCTLSATVDGKLAATESDSARFVIPTTCALGTPFLATVVATDAANESVTSAVNTNRAVVDVSPPAITPLLLVPPNYVATSNFAGAYGAGDTLHISFGPSDNSGNVAWLIYEVRPFGKRDSLPGTATDVPIVLDPGWSGNFQLAFSARDGQGNVTPPIVTPIDSMQLYPRTIRPVVTGSVPAGASAILLSPDHASIYLSYGDSTVHTISTATMQQTGVVRLPAVAGTLDLTANGDTLVATLPSLYALGMIDVRRSPGTVSVLRIAGLDTVAFERPRSLSTLANGHALVGVQGTTRMRMFDVDLSAGISTPRPGVPNMPYGTWCTTHASLDHRVVYGDPSCVFRYDLATDAFSIIYPRQWPDPRPDGDGQRLAWQHLVYDATGAQIADIDDRPWARYVWASTLSADGAVLYEARFDGLLSFRVSDGSVINQSSLPALPAGSYPPLYSSAMTSADGAMILLTGAAGSQISLVAVTLR